MWGAKFCAPILEYIKPILEYIKPIVYCNEPILMYIKITLKYKTLYIQKYVILKVLDIKICIPSRSHIL